MNDKNIEKSGAMEAPAAPASAHNAGDGAGYGRAAAHIQALLRVGQRPTQVLAAIDRNAQPLLHPSTRQIVRQSARVVASARGVHVGVAVQVHAVGGVISRFDTQKRC